MERDHGGHQGCVLECPAGYHDERSRSSTGGCDVRPEAAQFVDQARLRPSSRGLDCREGDVWFTSVTEKLVYLQRPSDDGPSDSEHRHLFMDLEESG